VTITFAHRGARFEAPENTIEAFRIALARGATGIETDAHLSADGQVVLVHDRGVRRGVRRRRVASSRAVELAAWGVPRLDDLYEALGVEYELSIDLKAPGVGPQVVALARARGAAERLWLCDPDLATLLELRGLAPETHLVHSTRRRAIGHEIERHAAELGRASIAAINLHHTDWTRGLVALFHRFDVGAFAWDVQETHHLRAMLAAGVDALYCDRVARMVAVVGEFESS